MNGYTGEQAVPSGISYDNCRGQDRPAESPTPPLPTPGTNLVHKSGVFGTDYGRKLRIL